MTVYYQGRVQGVGFRYTTARIADTYDVSGYVHNLPDGRVEVVAEGSEPTVNAFIDEIYKTMAHHIHHRLTSRADASGEFSDFRIRY